MLEHIRCLPPMASVAPGGLGGLGAGLQEDASSRPHPPPQHRVKTPVPKRKSRNLIKEEPARASADLGQSLNPISRLIQIQQAKHEKEPVYTLVVERGMPRRREFVMQVGIQ